MPTPNGPNLMKSGCALMAFGIVGVPIITIALVLGVILFGKMVGPDFSIVDNGWMLFVPAGVLAVLLVAMKLFVTRDPPETK